MTHASHHTPVLGAEVRRLAAGRTRCVDATVGDGGHTLLLLAAGATVLAIDRDPHALSRAADRIGAQAVTYLPGPFAAPPVLDAITGFGPDLVLLDLGVSARQLDEDARGFSFRPGVPLDMRMSGEGRTAADVLNAAPLPELARVFREHGDERRAQALARTVAERRATRPFASSDDLVNAIRRALGPRTGPSDFARLFQAIRMEVNDELGQLARALPAMRDALRPDGALVVIAYHSGEDRLVKHAFRDWSRACVCPPDAPVCRCRGRPLGRLVTRRPVRPEAGEVEANPRARSARLRVFERTDDC